jgi:hypothetical protein
MVIKTMTLQGNLIQASIGEAINPSSIFGKAINPNHIVQRQSIEALFLSKAINPNHIVARQSGEALS